MMKVVYIARVQVETDGRGPLVAFFNHHEAHTVSRGGRVEEIVVYESIAEYETAERERIRQRAMAKLTLEEQEALGLR